MEDDIDVVCRTCGRYEKCLQNFVGIPKGKKPFRRPRCKWKKC